MKRNAIVGIFVVLILAVLVAVFFSLPKEKRESVMRGYTVWTGTTKINDVSWSVF